MESKELFDGIRTEGALPACGIREIFSDSRRVTPGSLFVCLKGGKRDGHRYAAEALERGAAAILAEHPVPGVPQEKTLLTDDTRRAESLLWYHLTGRPLDGICKIGVTGTAGKTTVTLLLSEILRAAGRRTGVISTVRCEAAGVPVDAGPNGGSSVSDIPGAMTTPDPEYFFGAAKKMREAGCDVFLYEASSQSLAYGKTSAVVPDLAVFTNITPEHLDFHGTMDAYLRAKASLLRGVPRAVVNGDDRRLLGLPELYPDTDYTFCRIADTGSGEAKSGVTARNIRQLGADGMEYLWVSPRAAFRVRTPMPGLYSVMNTMLAAAAALLTGADPAIIRDAVSGFRGADGRMVRVRVPPARNGKEGPAVFIDYAHTPEAVEAVLGTVREFTAGPVTVVFGCGGERDPAKRPRMARAAERLADTVIVTSDNPRREDPDAIFGDILAGFAGDGPAAVIPDRARAIRYAVASSPPDGTVLLLGKGHEKYEITAEGKRPFDEEAIAREALAAYGAADG